MSKSKKYTVLIIVAIAVGLILSLPIYFKNNAVIKFMDSFVEAEYFESNVLSQEQLDEIKLKEFNSWVETTNVEKETMKKIGYLKLLDSDKVEILTLEVYVLENKTIAYGSKGQIMYPLSKR